MRSEFGKSIRKSNTLLGLQFLSDFGDQITTALLALVLLDITKSTEKVGLVYVSTILGYIIFTFVGGFLGDLLSRRNILFFADLGRALVVLLMIVAIKESSIVLIYLTSFCLSVLGSIHRPVKLGIWAQTIPDSLLERYNSMSELSVHTSLILGPLIASFFVAQNLISFGFIIDSLTFIICGLTFFATVSNSNSKKIRGHSVRKELIKGFRIITRQNEIAKYISYDAIQMIGFGAFNACFLILAQRDFGWTKVEYSYHLSIIAAFSIAGAFLGASKAVSRIDPRTRLKACALLSAICLSLVLIIESFPLASLLFGACNFLAVVSMVVTKSKSQSIAKKNYKECISSVIAARSIIIKSATLLGTGTCLLMSNFLELDVALGLFVFPIGFSWVPFLVMKTKKVKPFGSTVLKKQIFK